MGILATLSIPLFFAVFFALFGDRQWVPKMNAVVSFLMFVSSLFLGRDVSSVHTVTLFSGQLFADPLNTIFVVLTGLVSTTTAVYSIGYIGFEEQRGRLDSGRRRLYHSMYQMVVFSMLLGLFANNLGLLWVALETATLSNAFLISLYRTPKSIEAAWKYFVLLGVGIAQAFFGLILLYFAAERELGPGGTALLWTQLDLVKAHLNPMVLSLSFVFLFVGFGTKVGLVPLHGWLPDAHAEGPTPASAILSGLLLNVALYSIIRIKILVDGALKWPMAGDILIVFGTLSVVVAVFSFWKRNDVKRLFSYSSIEHLGIATVGFGLGGEAGTMAALLHMTFHSLTKSSIFFLVGTVSQWCGTQKIGEIRGLLRHAPFWGWSLILATCAILGVPPFGIFASEFLLFNALVHLRPWLAFVLVALLAVAFGVILKRVLEMVSGETAPPFSPPVFSRGPVLLHLVLVAVLGLGIPSFIWSWYQGAAHYLWGRV
ncbi:MAG: hydrogenase 4 subunit F [Leptospirales bacterium]